MTVHRNRHKRSGQRDSEQALEAPLRKAASAGPPSLLPVAATLARARRDEARTGPRPG
jgi:hypothetical protein